MNSPKNIEKLISELNLPGTKVADQRILDNALAAYDKSETMDTTYNKSSIWSTIMKNKITKFAAAAVLMLVGLVLGFYIGKEHISAPLAESVAINPSSIDGTILVKHHGSNTWQQLTQQSRLYIGDTFHSASKSQIRLAFKDNSFVEVYQNSMLVLKSYNGGTQFYLEQGRLKASLESPHPPFVISTPNGRVEALGTEFTISVE